MKIQRKQSDQVFPEDRNRGMEWIYPLGIFPKKKYKRKENIK